MDRVVFTTSLDQIRQGKRPLPPPQQNGIAACANNWLPDLREYAAALEAGYRELWDRLATYRGQARGRTLGEMVCNQWSEGACLGYAAMAMVQTGITRSGVVGILELMGDLMQQHGLDEAAEYHQSLIEGRKHAEEAVGA